MSDMAELYTHSDVRLELRNWCTNVCVYDGTPLEEFKCPQTGVQCEEYYLDGNLTIDEYEALLRGTPINLFPEVNMSQELRYDQSSNTVGLWQAFGGVDIDLNPQFFKTQEWTLDQIQQDIGPR